MYNANMPGSNDLPTSGQLIRSTVVAIIVATLLLITTVLPAEYGIDPTGAGEVLGLTDMGRVKMALAEEMRAEKEIVAAMENAPVMSDSEVEAVQELYASEKDVIVHEQSESSPVAADASIAKDEISIIFDPGQGAEIKLTMNKGASVSYKWQSDGPVNVDVHGDPVNAPKDFYHGYGKGKNIAKSEGTITAAFDGKHGWFWRNRSEKQVKVNLNTEGEYSEFKRVL
ncbi:MAG: transmembrane anchor protein [Deltaproteobacteria bacterium HGW-Deltaproteobacteria-18]|jgi:hypothetical protein|nr:MAG: transmembrane anchor protein [Deltaproteobacteria bacterium HGW-Deltaproteobacteria-18]